jgi:hypothetical protein
MCLNVKLDIFCVHLHPYRSFEFVIDTTYPVFFFYNLYHDLSDNSQPISVLYKQLHYPSSINSKYSIICKVICGMKIQKNDMDVNEHRIYQA